MIINAGTRVVNTYFISMDDGYLLIDTGYSVGYKSFRKKAVKNSIDIKGIKYIFLTHAHGDHAGYLNDVLNETEAKVVLHLLAVEV